MKELNNVLSQSSSNEDYSQYPDLTQLPQRTESSSSFRANQKQ